MKGLESQLSVQSLYSLDVEAGVNLGSLEEVTLSEESEHSEAVHCN